MAGASAKGPLLNVGLGRAGGRALAEHVRQFGQFLREQGRIAADLTARFQGHAYQLYDHSARPLLADGVLWIGDAAGLACTQSGEGIRPAIESGLLAAQVIADAAGDYRRQRLEPYRRKIEGRFGRRRQRPAAARAPSALRRLLGRSLLTRRWFVRRIVLERWFLHQRQAVLGLKRSPLRASGCPDTVCVRCQLNYQCRGIRYPQVITKNRKHSFMCLRFRLDSR